jgi:alanyl-tRNA synthetase
MKAREIRRSFLDFFAEKNHHVVSSASLLPQSPNLLFTNAGMNQFVPYFLGDQKAPFPKATDTQKCIRAGGKHNDLEDVGLDTYHHTFFEMLGNWSFGDYFKKDAIAWAWELLVDRWKFPANRLYATVYKPEEGDPADFDEEAHKLWENIFVSAGLDPKVHVVTGGKKDNFWMMGETGPCGPCSELHLDLTAKGDSRGQLVNQDSHLCIEIWNLVFIQFNADKKGTFSPLESKHVDTGMGFERVAAVMQSTQNFTDFSKLAPVLIEQMGDVFPELIARSELIEKTLKSEEESFNKTLDRGIELFNRETKELTPGDVVSGDFAFKLYDTYGFPLDLTDLMARESGLTVNHEEFKSQMDAQKNRAREAHKSVEILVNKTSANTEATTFCGYETSNLNNFTATCTDLVQSGENIFLVADQTPFYAEMGGQVGDTGKVSIEGSVLEIENVVKDSSGRFLHQLDKRVKDLDWVGKSVQFDVNLSRRRTIQQHHTATHVLHWALREVLGDHVRQAGSLVQPDRLRFDFSHFEALSEDQLKTIEKISNEKLLLNEELLSYEVPFAEKPDGVIAFFGEKYGDVVRVVDLGGWSQELCGGTHVRSGGEIGSIRVVSESAISSGTRRLEAVAGFSAYEWASNRVNRFNQLVREFSCKPDELESRIQQIQTTSKQLEKKLRSIEQKDQAGLADQLIQSAIEKQGVRIIAQSVHGVSANELRGLASQVNKRTEPSVVLLASEKDDKCSLVCICSNDAMDRGFKAGEIIRELSLQIGGKGGGKPDFAMGGGAAGKGVTEAIARHSLVS